MSSPIRLDRSEQDWRRATQGDSLVAFLSSASTLAVGCLFLIQLLLKADPRAWQSSSLSLFAVFSAVLLIRLAQLAGSPCFSFVRASFYLFCFVWMALAPLAQLAFHLSPLGYTVEPKVYVHALWITVVGILAFEMGWATGSRPYANRARSSVGQDPAFLRRLELSTYLGLLVTLSALGLVGGPKVLTRSHTDFASHVFADAGSSKASGGLLYAILIVTPFVLSFVWLSAVKRWSALIARQKACACLTVLITLLIENPVAQSRFWVATVYVSLAATVLRNRPAAGRAVIPAALGFLVIVFPFSDIFRYNTSRHALQVVDPLTMLASKGDFDAFPQLNATLLHVQDHGTSHGGQVLGAMLFFLPRVIWPGKAVDTGVLLGRENSLGNVNLSAPLWAEGFINFGVVGVIAFLAVFGYIMHKLVVHARQLGLGPAPEYLIGVFSFVLLRGSLLQSMGTTFVLVTILATIVRSKEHRGSDANRRAPTAAPQTRRAQAVAEIKR